MTDAMTRLSPVEESTSLLRGLLDNFCDDPQRREVLRVAQERRTGLVLRVEGTMRDLEVASGDPENHPLTMSLGIFPWKQLLAALSTGPREEAASHFDAGRGVLVAVTQDGRLRLRGYTSRVLSPGGSA